MSIITMPDWVGRKRQQQPRRRPLDGPIPSGDDTRPHLKLPPDLEQDLERALDEPFGKPARTSNAIADDIAYFSARGDEARALAEQADQRVEELRVEFYAQLEKETAAIRAEHDEKLAKLDELKASVATEKKDDVP